MMRRIRHLRATQGLARSCNRGPLKVGGLFMALWLTACGVSEGSSGSSSQHSISTSTEVRSRPSVASDPNDLYNAYLADDLLAINSATVELEYKCYAESGFPQFLEVLAAQKANSFRSLATTPDFKSTFISFSELPWYPNEEYARSVGFGRDTPGLDSFVNVSDPSFRLLSEQCKESASSAIGGFVHLVKATFPLATALQRF